MIVEIEMTDVRLLWTCGSSPLDGEFKATSRSDEATRVELSGPCWRAGTSIRGGEAAAAGWKPERNAEGELRAHERYGRHCRSESSGDRMIRMSAIAKTPSVSRS